MRVGIAGSPDYSNEEAVRFVLSRLRPATIVVFGNYSGAARLAVLEAKRLGCELEVLTEIKAHPSRGSSGCRQALAWVDKMVFFITCNSDRHALVERTAFLNGKRIVMMDNNGRPVVFRRKGESCHPPQQSKIPNCASR